MKGTLLVIGIILFILWAGIRIVDYYQYEINCGGHLKRAADSNTVETAKKELDIALKFMEDDNLTNGYTSIIFRTPDEDMGFWYENIKSARQELDKITEETTLLERTNTLMKLRETLLDNDSGGDSVTEPSGISVYPNNKFYALLCLISFVLIIAGGIGEVVDIY